MRNQMSSVLSLVIAAAGALSVRSAVAADKPMGIVSHVKVLSDKVQDVSSIEAWKGSFIKDDMKPADKGLAIWKSVAMFGLEGAPIESGMGGGEDCNHDVIKTFNVYGCDFCCCSAGMVEELGRATGMETRGWNLHGHNVSDLYYDNSWHLLDAAYMNYFPKPDGSLASVEEIRSAVKEWYAANPQYVGNLRSYKGGWKNGPALLAASPLLDAKGSFPSVFCDWTKTMGNYDGGGGTPSAHNQGYFEGYQVNIQLRKGERLTRNWAFNPALPHPYLPKDEYGILDAKVGQGVLKFSPQYGDLANGRVGHGLVEYDVPLADGSFRGGALVAENVSSKGEDKAGPAVHVKDAAKPGVIVIRMPSSYLYLTGKVAINAVVAAGGEIVAEFSQNNGLDWSEIGRFKQSAQEEIDLGSRIENRFDYQVRFTMSGAGTGLDGIKFTHDILQSQRALPALGKGDNSIAFSAGNEGTITITGNATDPNCTKQVKITDFHPAMDNVAIANGLQLTGNGSATFTVNTPGEMTRLRFGGHYRARDARDGWDYQVSFDNGKTFQTITRAAGPTVSSCKYVTVDKVPSGTKSALVRFAGKPANTTMMFRMRIDADYSEPQGGFAPIKVTYKWEEDGKAKEDVHVARTPEDKYTINCAAKPTMKSITTEWAQ